MPNPYVTLVESWKDMPANTQWSEPDPADGQMSFLAPLTIDGVTVGAFSLRATCSVDLPDRDVTFQLETGIHGQRTRLPLARIDWRPLSGGHKQPKNSNGKKVMIYGSHYHSIHDNWLEAEQRMRETNLPWAQPLDPDPESFAELLDLARILFRINNITTLVTPKWAAKF